MLPCPDYFHPSDPLLPGINDTLCPSAHLYRSSRICLRLPDSEDWSMDFLQKGHLTPYTTLFLTLMSFTWVSVPDSFGKSPTYLKTSRVAVPMILFLDSIEFVGMYV